MVEVRNIIYYYFSEIKKGKIKEIPGSFLFFYYFRLFGEHVFLVDRTETIKTPINMEVLYKIPKYRKFDKTYKQVCDERAKEIVRRLDENNKKLYILYSGGIDSTLVIVQILKFATKKVLENTTVLMSYDSYKEYDLFYEQFIFGKLKVENISNLNFFFRQNSYFISGELNDLSTGVTPSPKILK